MKCASCGSELPDHVKFCTNCGASVRQAPQSAPVQSFTPPAPPPIPPKYMTQAALPPEHKPLSPWAYYGLQLLFSIPLVGFICLIVFSLDDSNINRRNFARSYWCSLIITLALIIILVVLLFATGLGSVILSELENISA